MIGMVVLGVLAQIVKEARAGIVAELAGREGVTVFAVADEARLGMVIERPTLEEAVACLEAMGGVAGIVATWPVFSHEEPVGAAPTA